MDEQKIRKVVIAFYAAKLLGANVTMTFGVYVLMLKHAGLNFVEINLVSLFFVIGILLFEVPTGSYADSFGHKKSFVAGLAIEGVGLAMYFLSSGFWGFAAAEFVIAFAAALQSGSLSAWAVNKLRKYGKKTGYARMFSRAYILERVATLALVWIGAKIGYCFGLSWPFLIAGIMSFASAAVLWRVMNNNDQPVPRANINHWHEFKRNISAGRKIIVSHERLALLLGICFVISFVTQPINKQWSILYETRFHTLDLSMPVFFQVLGTIMGAGLVTEFSRRFKSMVWQFGLLTVFIAATIIIIPQTGDWAMFMAVLFIHEIPRGMVFPLEQTWVNEIVQDDACRATVSSYFGMLWTLAAGSGLLFSGFWAEWFGIKICWQTIGSAGIIILLAFIAISRKKRS